MKLIKCINSPKHAYTGEKIDNGLENLSYDDQMKIFTSKADVKNPDSILNDV